MKYFFLNLFVTLIFSCVLGYPAAAFAASPSPTPSKPPCDSCLEVSQGGACLSSGRHKCPDGRCVDSALDCECPENCKICVEECNYKTRKCEPSGWDVVCPDGTCVLVEDMCPTNCNPRCAFCTEVCARTKGYGTGKFVCLPDPVNKLCPDGRCVGKNDPCVDECNPPCDSCTQKCGDVMVLGIEEKYVKRCKPSFKKRCPDGRCISRDSDCTKKDIPPRPSSPNPSGSPSR